MKSLKIQHPLYGYFIIHEPVLIELINSSPLQRLKGIDNRGAWRLHQSYPGSLSRFQHSLGVMLLLRKFNASLEEQIAGLLHDVSHTAFSHVIDFVFGSHTTQDYQDKKLIQAFKLQGIEQILKKHGFKPKRIYTEKNFLLLERELPDLCADRIDYTLQDPWLKSLSNEPPKSFLNHLKIYKNNWAFTDYRWAKKFGYLYLRFNQKNFCAPLQSALYYLLSEIIKTGLKKNIISKKDLFTTDQYLITRLKSAGETEINHQFKVLKKLRVKIVPKNQADFHTHSKTRVVDPYFIKNDKLIRLSKADPKYQERINRWLKKVKPGFYIKVINT